MKSAARILLADPQLRELLPLVLPVRKMPQRAYVVIGVDLKQCRHVNDNLTRRPAGRATRLVAEWRSAEWRKSA